MLLAGQLFGLVAVLVTKPFRNSKGNAMSRTVLDGLRFVLQNMRLQQGDMAKIQADIVAQAIIEIEALDQHVEKLEGYKATVSI